MPQNLARQQAKATSHSLQLHSAAVLTKVGCTPKAEVKSEYRLWPRWLFEGLIVRATEPEDLNSRCSSTAPVPISIYVPPYHEE